MHDAFNLGAPGCICVRNVILVSNAAAAATRETTASGAMYSNAIVSGVAQLRGKSFAHTECIRMKLHSF